MNAIPRLIALLLAAVLTSCVMGDKISEIRPGMTKAQVIAKLGTPDGYRSGANGYEMLRYSNRLASGWDIREKGDYSVVLQNGICGRVWTGQRAGQASAVVRGCIPAEVLTPDFFYFVLICEGELTTISDLPLRRENYMRREVGGRGGA